MPGSNVDLYLIIGSRGSGKSETAIPIFLSYQKGVWLDMGVASNYFLFKKDNRLQLSIPRSKTLKDALYYMVQNSPSHFSFQPQNQEEAKLFISEFSKKCKGSALFVDDCQKLLSYYDSVNEYKDFISDGRMNEQNLILCCHRITEVSTKTRTEANKIIHMGPIERPADIKRLYDEWIPTQGEDIPSLDVLYREMRQTLTYTPYYLKNK